MTASYPAAHTPGVPADVESILRAGGRVARLFIIPATRMGLRLLKCSNPRSYHEVRDHAGTLHPARPALPLLAEAIHQATGLTMDPREMLLALRLILRPRITSHASERRLRLVATPGHLKHQLPALDLAPPLSVNYIGLGNASEPTSSPTTYHQPDPLEGPRLLAHYSRHGEAALAIDLLTRQVHAVYVATSADLFVPMLRITYPAPGGSLRVPLVCRVDRLGNPTWSACIGEVRPDLSIQLAGMPARGVSADAPIAFTFLLYGVPA